MPLSLAQNQAVFSKKAAAAAALKYAAALALQFALSNAPFYGIRPFGTGLYIALLFLDAPFLLVSPVYITAELAGGGLAGLLSGLVVCAAAGLAHMARVRLPQKKLGWLFPLAAVFSAAGPAAVITLTGYGPLHIVLYAAFAVLFAYAAKAVGKPVLKERLRYKMLETEVICLGAVGIAAAAGLAAFDARLFGFPVSCAAVVFCICVAAKTTGPAKAAVVGLVFGIGYAVYTSDVPMIACFPFIALVAAVFVSAPKIIMPLAGLAAYLMFRFFFLAGAGTDGAWLWAAAVAAGGMFYLCVPSKILIQAKNYLFASSERAAVRYMVNRNRSETAARLAGASGVFRSMAESLAQMQTPLPDYDGSLKNKCCVLCAHLPKCAGASLDRSLDAMLSAVFEKGRANIADIPPYVSDRCVNLAGLLNAAAAIGGQRAAYLAHSANERDARLAVETQMRSMAGVLDDLAAASAVPVSYDAEREKALVEELNYAGVAASEALVTDGAATLVLRTESFDRKAVEKTVSRVLRRGYTVASVDDTVLSGFCCVSLNLRPRYDIVFGAAAAAKTADGNSGDTHSFIKIDGRRFMMALCDGMGSGEQAKKTSETAVGLVENFYRAGFAGDLALKSVNQFLNSVGGENFSALDICVVDLDSGTADIIKLGSPATYLKRKDTVERFEGDCAPIGVMDTITPSAARVALNGGDMLVLASDGVAESFAGDKLAAAVNNLRTVNPQVLSEGILEHAIYNSGGKARDDATVLAARLIAV